MDEKKQNNLLQLALYKGFTNIDELSLIDKYPTASLALCKRTPSRSVRTAPIRRVRETLVNDEHYSFILITLQMLIKAKLPNDEIAKETAKLYERHKLKRMDYIELLKQQISKIKSIPSPKRCTFKESPLLSAFITCLKENCKISDAKYSTNGFSKQKKERFSNADKAHIIVEFLSKDIVKNVFSELMESLAGDMKSVLAPPRISTAIRQKRREEMPVDPLIEEIAGKC